MTQMLLKSVVILLCLIYMLGCTRRTPVPSGINSASQGSISVSINGNTYKGGNFQAAQSDGSYYFFSSNSSARHATVLNLVMDDLTPGKHYINNKLPRIMYIRDDTVNYKCIKNNGGWINITRVDYNGISGTFEAVLKSAKPTGDTAILVDGVFTNLPIQ